MNDHSFDIGGDLPESRDLPEATHQHRQDRQADIIRGEADEARQIGTEYDARADEFEMLLAEHESSYGDDLTIVLRHLLEEGGDVKDPGSVDGGFVRRLGLDVCIKPELIEICIKVAKINSKEEKIYAEDIIDAWQYIEQEYNDNVDTSKGAEILLAHGAEPQDIIDLVIEDPRSVRSYARLLDAPILARYSQRLATNALKTKGTLPLDTIISAAMALIRKHNKLQEALEAGDPAAITANELLLRSTKLAEAAGEAAMRAEAESGPSRDLPRPEENGTT